MIDTNYFKPKDFAKMLNVSTKTLQRWDLDGLLVAYRTPTNRRYYTYDQYLQFKGITLEDTRKIAIYSRVSSRGQSDELKNQVEFLKTFCNARGYIIDEVITDIGSGLNYNRANWNKLLDEVMSNKVKTIIIAYKDRFIRFGYDWFEQFCAKFNTEIIVVNNETYSPYDELVQDIISILHVFSCRLYGLRKYKNKIKEDNDIVKMLQNRDTTDRTAETKDS